MKDNSVLLERITLLVEDRRVAATQEEEVPDLVEAQINVILYRAA